jgi:ribonuclease BN (tRNA processing enzyme)
MKIVMLGCSASAARAGQYVSTYLINGKVAIDAGCLGFYGTPQDQEAVRHVFLTHSHADHIASLALFVENAWTPSPECPIVYGNPETLDTIQRSIFNDQVWPDFVALSKGMPPFLRLETVRPEVPIRVEGLTITPVPVCHSVPTVGYVVQEGERSVIFSSDTASTERLWEVARKTPGLQAVFLEATFPNRMKAIADASLHMTSEMFGRELAKVPEGVRVIAVHLKVRYKDEIMRELDALGAPHLEIGECDREYVF